MIDKLKLHFLTVVVGLLFCLSALIKRGRATHAFGPGAAGRFKVTDDPQFPEHDLFRAGRTFTAQLRHGTVSSEDEATLDLRGASLKLSDGGPEDSLDLVMNTGVATFMHAKALWDFTMGLMGGEKGLEEALTGDPDGFRLFVGSVRRAPSSFAQMYYYSKLPFYFRARDGRLRYVRFRLVPENRGEESGLPDARDQKAPWFQKRREDCDLPTDYLRREFRQRLEKGEIVYHLDLSLREATDHDTEEVFSQLQQWDPETSPWIPLGTLTLDGALSEEETERLHFNIARQPKTMGLVPARSIYDPNSVAHMRARVYNWSRRLRFFLYWLTGKMPGGRPFKTGAS